jgi:hypothetical protein
MPFAFVHQPIQLEVVLQESILGVEELKRFTALLWPSQDFDGCN